MALDSFISQVSMNLKCFNFQTYLNLKTLSAISNWPSGPIQGFFSLSLVFFMSPSLSHAHHINLSELKKNNTGFGAIIEFHLVS